MPYYEYRYWAMRRLDTVRYMRWADGTYPISHVINDTGYCLDNLN